MSAKLLINFEMQNNSAEKFCNTVLVYVFAFFKICLKFWPKGDCPWRADAAA